MCPSAHPSSIPSEDVLLLVVVVTSASFGEAIIGSNDIHGLGNYTLLYVAFGVRFVKLVSNLSHLS